MNKKKKLSRKWGAIISLAVIFPVSLTAFALHYFSNQEVNIFKEGKANIQIAENNVPAGDMIELDLFWEKEIQDETVYYVSDKLVTFKSEFDDQNLRVMLIPSWWKENNLVAGLANSKYTDFSYVKLNRSVSELTLDVYTANDILIMSYLLNPSSFSKNWEIPTGEKISLDSFYLHYKGTEQLKKEEVSAPLITAVRIPEEVYNTMYPDYELHIDVIADAIEKYGDAVDNRNFN
ncbi:MAG: hypothetical protein VZR10_09135 [Methanobrevibacter sp.]|nr:hypothetical protein [Methanobrevibacter sp.]